MKDLTRFDHEFVEYIPRDLEPSRVYISIPFATAAHSCVCGCGSRVVTPLSPDDWRVTFDGETVSFWPSIGNWAFDCQSHYWLRDGKIIWALRMSASRFTSLRERHEVSRAAYFEGLGQIEPAPPLHGLRRLKRISARLAKAWPRTTGRKEDGGSRRAR